MMMRSCKASLLRNAANNHVTKTFFLLWRPTKTTYTSIRTTASRAASMPQRALSVAFRREYSSSSPTWLPATTNFSKESNPQPWKDPAARQYLFWNRESSASGSNAHYLLEISPESIQTNAHILSLSAHAAEDAANTALHDGPLPTGAQLLAVGTTVEELEQGLMKKTKTATTAKSSSPSPPPKPNVLFVSPSCPHAATVLPQVLQRFPSIEWVHVRSAGIDFVESPELVELCNTPRPIMTAGGQTIEKYVRVTNAKGQFSSSLAEYVMLVCNYFAKNVPRLVQQQAARQWIKYDVQELRGSTLGIIGYGDIGRAVAKLGSVFGMRIVALRRHAFLSLENPDPYCNKVYDRSEASLCQLMSESDYIVCSAPSTVETRGMVAAAAFEAVKPGAVFINLGRGPVVDDDALVAALQSGKLKGAALDVFTEEPLPQSSPYWDLDNILISPHNMDQTATFMHEATEFFVRENLPRFMVGEDLLNPVDPELGY